MKRISFSLLTAVLLLILVGCGNVSAPPDISTASLEPSVAQTPTGATPAPSAAQVGEASITLTVNGQEFTVTLLDNETARELTAMLPLTLDMSELNGNEKYFYLDTSLTTDAQHPGQIHAGDLMLYGNNCIVLFYESFSSNYSYTPLGNVDDPTGLADSLGAGSVTVTFSLGE